MPRGIAIYLAPDKCVNSRRFLEKLDRCKLTNIIVIDIARDAPPEDLEAVPTVVLQDGTALVGHEAFLWLADNSVKKAASGVPLDGHASRF